MSSSEHATSGFLSHPSLNSMIVKAYSGSEGSSRRAVLLVYLLRLQQVLDKLFLRQQLRRTRLRQAVAILLFLWNFALTVAWYESC